MLPPAMKSQVGGEAASEIRWTAQRLPLVTLHSAYLKTEDGRSGVKCFYHGYNEKAAWAIYPCAGTSDGGRAPSSGSGRPLVAGTPSLFW